MPRAGLTADRLAGVAADLADARGWDALTLAAVAEQVGVRQPSLYKHVAGLDGLRRAVRLRALAELRAALADAVIGRAGTDAVLALGAAYRDYARAHPGRYAATVTAPAADDGELVAAAESVLAVVTATLAGYDLTGDDAIHAVRGLRALLHGFVAIDAAGGFALAQDRDESFRRLLLGYDAALRSPTSGVH